MNERWDETWHRLFQWTDRSGKAERLAAQILIHEGFEALDPAHPLGGRDSGKDALCKKDDKDWAMAVWFPKGEKRFSQVERKFLGDLKAARKNNVEGMAFVTNQDLRLAERRKLEKMAAPTAAVVYHLEKLVLILDKPEMSQVRRQFLGIGPDETAVAFHRQRLDAVNAIWKIWSEFVSKAPSIFGFLYVLTPEEERTLNRNPRARAVFPTERDFLAWMKIAEAAELQRSLIGEELWLQFSASRVILGRIPTLYLRDRDASEVASWREDPIILENMLLLFTPDEVTALVTKRIGAVLDLNKALEQKLLAKIEYVRSSLM